MGDAGCTLTLHRHWWSRKMKLMDIKVNCISFVNVLYWNLTLTFLLVCLFLPPPFGLWPICPKDSGRAGRGAFGFMPGYLCICVFIDMWECKGRLLSTHIPPLPRDKSCITKSHTQTHTVLCWTDCRCSVITFCVVYQCGVCSGLWISTALIYLIVILQIIGCREQHDSDYLWMWCVMWGEISVKCSLLAIWKI